jgi:hypothetical protein
MNIIRRRLSFVSSRMGRDKQHTVSLLYSNRMTFRFHWHLIRTGNCSSLALHSPELLNVALVSLLATDLTVFNNVQIFTVSSVLTYLSYSIKK